MVARGSLGKPPTKEVRTLEEEQAALGEAYPGIEAELGGPDALPRELSPQGVR